MVCGPLEDSTQTHVPKRTTVRSSLTARPGDLSKNAKREAAYPPQSPQDSCHCWESDEKHKTKRLSQRQTRRAHFPSEPRLSDGRNHPSPKKAQSPWTRTQRLTDSGCPTNAENKRCSPNASLCPVTACFPALACFPTSGVCLFFVA